MEQKNSIAIIFIGLQGSGKTWYFNQHFSSEYEHINLDTLRTRKREQQIIEECIARGMNLVIDNTNPTKEDRQRYISQLKSAGYRVIGYFFESRVKDCIRRNAQRIGAARVPDVAIAATSNKLELPSKSEGFDELYFVKRESEFCMKKVEWRDDDEV